MENANAIQVSMDLIVQLKYAQTAVLIKEDAKKLSVSAMKAGEESTAA